MGSAVVSSLCPIAKDERLALEYLDRVYALLRESDEKEQDKDISGKVLPPKPAE